jgi:CBS domain-containing membrane protein
MRTEEMTKHPQDREVPMGNVDLTDKDVYEAMKAMPGYLDITPGDFKELYCYAFRQAAERIAGSVLAKDMMATDVISMKPDTPLHEVADAMGSRGISGVPVVDEDHKVVGVISEKDFLARMGDESPKNFMAVIANCLKAKGCIALPVRAKSAGDIMSSPAITVCEETPFSDIAAVMAQKAINRLPVVDQQGRLVGIITRNDLIAASAGNRTCSRIISPK